MNESSESPLPEHEDVNISPKQHFYFFILTRNNNFECGLFPNSDETTTSDPGSSSDDGSISIVKMNQNIIRYLLLDSLVIILFFID